MLFMGLIGAITYLVVFGGIFLFFWTSVVWWAWKVLHSLHHLLLHPLLIIVGMTDGGEARAIGQAAATIGTFAGNSEETTIWERERDSSNRVSPNKTPKTPKTPTMKTPIGKQGSHKDHITQMVEDVSASGDLAVC